MPSMVVHSCNPNNQEVETEGLRVQGPVLYSKTLFQNKTRAGGLAQVVEHLPRKQKA
jgi:hypothetical protein